jgi:hypothetical protein
MKTAENDRVHNIFNTYEISGGKNPRIKRFMKGSLARGFAKLSKRISYTSLKSYGAFFLSFGLVTLLLNLTKYYVLDNPVIEPFSLTVGAVFSFVSIPFLFIDKPLCTAVQELFVTDYILFEFLSLKRLNKIPNPPSIPVILSVFLGIIPSSLGFIFSLRDVLIAMLVLVILMLSFESLEFPMILTLLLAPYLSFVPHKTYIIAALSVLAFVGYFARVAIGKRVHHLDFYGIVIFLFGVLITVSGLIGYGQDSAHNAWLYLALLLGYYPASGLVVNRRLTDAALKAIVFASLPISLYALTTDSIHIIKNGFVPDTFYYGSEAGGERSFIIVAYLLLSAVFTLMFALEKNHRYKKNFYTVFFIIDVLGIATVSQLGALITLVFALLGVLIVFKRDKSGYILFPFSLILYFIPFIPNTYLDKLSAFLNFKLPLSTVSDKILENIGVALENPFFGVGIGKDSYDAYLGEVAVRVDNMLVGIASSVGIAALVLLLFILIVRFIQSAVYSRFTKYSSVHIASNMTTVAILTLIMLGAFGNFFEYPELFYMFFSIFGISTATLRVSKKETDDRLNYYGDSRSSETSAIDVNIS